MKNLVNDGTVKDPHVKMLLVNAVYVRGRWEFPFERMRTFDRPTLFGAEHNRTVPMMKQSIAAGSVVRITNTVL